jgi:hypothetical protein
MAQPPTNEAIVGLLAEIQTQLAAIARELAEMRGRTATP